MKSTIQNKLDRLNLPPAPENRNLGKVVSGLDVISGSGTVVTGSVGLYWRGENA